MADSPEMDFWNYCVDNDILMRPTSSMVQFIKSSKSVWISKDDIVKEPREALKKLKDEIKIEDM